MGDRIGAMGVIGAVTLLAALDAEAVRMPAELQGRPAMELATGRPLRGERVLSWFRTPRAAVGAYASLRQEMGPGTEAVWDPATGVPSRIWGGGIAVPGSVSSPKVAAGFAKAFLQRHIALLAPGASMDDFRLVSNDLDAGMRTLGYEQSRAGLPVIGGQLSLRFKNDRLFMIGSEALPHVQARVPSAPVDAAKLRAQAEAWLLSDVATQVQAGAVEGPMVLPLVEHRRVGYRTVHRVTVRAEQPLGRWHVYLDAESGAVVARQQTLRFATGTLLYNAPVRRPGDTRDDYAAMHANVTVDANPATTDANGLVNWSGTANASLVARADGQYATVNNVGAGEATQSLTLAPSGNAVWDGSASETVDAQVTTFTHTNEIIDYTRSFASGLAYLDTQVQANVNINNACNAFYDSSSNSINFYLSNNNCNNTGRLSDVVYHEYGHSLHVESIIQGVGSFDGALSEGVADFLSATFTGDPGMGRGFFKTNAPLRQLDPPNTERVWPDDIGEIHQTGLIIGGALWDLRKLLVAQLGEPAGVAQTNHIYYQAMRRSVDIPTMYFEALAADDDDGDLSNGTPNVCLINEAFAAHGLRRMLAEAEPESVRPPHLAGYDLTLEVTGLYSQCPEDANATAELEWRLREDDTVGGTMAMTTSATGFEATIPPQDDGAVVQYQVRLSFGGGGGVTYPDNPGDRWYEMFIGHVEPIYCTDFNFDPEMEGWTHGLTSGQQGEGADDWMWGPPGQAPASGDPSEAWAGNNVFGNDLGGGNFNGKYQPDKTNYALTPTIDVSGHDVVRLQYRRWLTVEDGFFDQANIYANDQLAWTNFNSNMGNDSAIHHVDKEWRFHDVDLTDHVVNDEVAIKFEIDTDQGLHMGGWTLDAFCVVGWVPTVCGDGVITGAEECDDGDANSDSEADACRSSCLEAYCGDGVTDGGEECDDANSVEDDTCTTSCTAVANPVDPNDPTNPAAPPLVVDDGCGCRLGPKHDGQWYWLLLAGFGLLTIGRRLRD